MKHLKYSIPVRFLAVLLAVLSAVAAIAGSFTALMIYEMGLYKIPLEQAISKNFQSLQEFYSAKLYLNKDTFPDCLKDTNLEYGIIQEEYDPNLYLTGMYKYDYYNFKTNPQKDSLIMPFHENQIDDNKNPTLWESLFNQYHYYMNDLDSECLSPLESILYNEETGIFYFKTSEYAIPVYHILLNSAYAEYKENSSAKQTKKEAKDNYVSFTLNTQKLQYESDSDLFQPLDTKKYLTWKKFATQPDYYWFKPSDIKIFSDKDLTSIAAIKDNNVWLTQISGTKYVHYYEKDVSLSEKTFCIVSQITEPLDMQKNDLFVRQKNALTFLYNIRIPCLVIAACGFVSFLLLLAFCCYSTGSTADTAFVSISWLHKLPLLLYLTVIGSLIGGLAVSMVLFIDKMFHTDGRSILFLLPCLFFLALAAFLLVLAAMNVSRRYKAGILWKSTLCCLILTRIHRLAEFGKTGLQLFHEHTSLLVRGTLIMGGIIFIEIMLFLYGTYQDELFFFLWLILKIAELVIILAFLLQMKQLQIESQLLAEGNLEHKLDTSHMAWEFKKHGEYLNQIGDGMTIALEERMKSEHFRTELITNVSHDIKTPLTSIINYVDLLQKETILSETAKEYLEVLDRQSARLKKLIEDLMEASKASTGNLTINPEKCDIDILLTQTIGEFEEKLSFNQLELITQSPNASVYILADSRHLWRIFENLMNNICKYAQPGTRVYINLETDEKEAHMIFRNISNYALTISGEDLLERFVRGDSSRNTEGNGLGLSIAQSLTELMNGTLKIYADGDLFKVILTFPRSA